MTASALGEMRDAAHAEFSSDVTASAVASAQWQATGADALLSTILEHIAQGVLVADKDLRIVAFNRRYLELLSLPPGFVRLGMSYGDILRYNATRRDYADPEAHVRERLEQARTRREPWRTEHLRPDGTVVSIRRVPIPGGGFIYTYTDITKRKRAEQEAAKTTVILRETLENMADGVRVFDADLRLAAFNKRAFELLGYPMSLAQAGTPYDAFAQYTREQHNFSDEDEAAMQARIARARSGEKRATEQTTRDGRIIRKQRNPMPDGGFVSTYTDVTDLKRAEQALAAKAAELEAAMTELRRSNAELEQFAYVASHDLQEPLRMVASYCQLLQKRYAGKLDGNADEFIAFAVEGANRMRQLVTDLLAYSRVGTKGKAFADVALEKVLADALVNLSVATGESGARVTHDPLPVVFGDNVQLLQLLQNLIANAIKFRGEAAPEIHLDAQRDGDRWLVRVRDNGIGIDPQHAERIFLIFQRLHTRQKYPGTGIGLAVCKKIVERHEGRIWVESEPGKGSAFCFTLRGGQG